MSTKLVNGQKLKSGNFGPGLLVTAAFVGPGTVATASHAGATFGFSLLWALGFSIVATLVLQEMAARLGIITGKGLGEAIRELLPSGPLAIISTALVVLAIGFGNAAFQTGNITGAAMALASISSISIQIFSVLIGVVAGLILLTGKYYTVERILIVLVLAMSGIFLLTAIVAFPEISILFKETRKPIFLSNESTTTIIALIGTTVVPYNLFLHSNAVTEKWSHANPLDESIYRARLDSSVSIGLGGLITLAIISTSAVSFFGSTITISQSSMGNQLVPLLGPMATFVFAIGLFASGLTSAITAPMAAAYAVSGVMGWNNSMSSKGFRNIWLFVLVVGTALASLNLNPLEVIITAQVANGILLPLVAVFLLVVMNSSILPKKYQNGALANSCGVLTILLLTGLTITKVFMIFI